jgi:hypothetical protein
MTESRKMSKEWRVRLDLQLDQEQHDQVTKAIQSAVLGAVAEFDLAGDYSVRLVGPGERGRVFGDGGGLFGDNRDPFGVEPEPGVPDGAVMKMPDDLLGPLP